MTQHTKEELEQMLYDVVEELDLSDVMIDKHGPSGTPPALLVREVLSQKDLQIAMLRRGFVDVVHNASGDGTALHDEPMFILLGRDPIGASLVAMWADARETLDETDPKIAEARECAGNMLVWCAHEALKTPQHALWLLPFEALARELRRRGATVTPVPHGGDFDNTGYTPNGT